MDKLSLSQLPKDILIELVCKNFENLSLEDSIKICADKWNSCKRLLFNKEYINNLCIKCNFQFISVENVSAENGKEVYYIKIPDSYISIPNGYKNARINYTTLIELQSNIQVILSERGYSDEVVNFVIHVTQKHMQIYNLMKASEQIVKSFREF